MTQGLFGTENTLSVLVVDDARFTCEMIRRTLRAHGFYDVRVAITASEALDRIGERRADIVLADWLMPEMDGLELTRRLRQHDEENQHYTYVILLTAREGADSLTEAFNHGVDDFIGKSPDHKELIARVTAAARITALQNDLIQANRRLIDLNRQLGERDGVDVGTGLGNHAYLENRLQALIRHLEGRGGTGLCGLVRINDLPRHRDDSGDEAVNEVIAAVAARLQHTIRPLDVVGRLTDDTFGLLMIHHGTDQPHPHVFKRIFNALNLRAYKTSRGFLNITTAIALTAFRAPWTEAPRPDQLLHVTAGELDTAQETGRVIVRRWHDEGNPQRGPTRP